MDEGLLERTLKTVVETGRYVLGGREVSKSVKGSKLIVYSSSVSEALTARVLEACRSSSVPCMAFKGGSVKLGSLCGKPFKVSAIAVRSPGEADLAPLIEAAVAA